MDACVIPIEIVDQVARRCDKLRTIRAIMLACKAAHDYIKRQIAGSPLREHVYIGGILTSSIGKYWKENYIIVNQAVVTRAWAANELDTRETVEYLYGWPTRYRIYHNYGPGIKYVRCSYCGIIENCSWIYNCNTVGDLEITARSCCPRCWRGSDKYELSKLILVQRLQQLGSGEMNYAELNISDAMRFVDKIGVTLCYADTYAKLLQYQSGVGIKYVTTV